MSRDPSTEDRSFRGGAFPTPPPDPTPPGGGFGHSKRRLALEVGGVLLALALLIGGGLWLLGGAASMVVGLLPVELDRAVGEATWNQLVPAEKRCTDPAALEYVEAVVAPLLEVYEGPHSFTFAVVDDGAINAFALPGGFIAVNRGLLEKAQSGEEVAAVLAHEMIHVTERHGLRRIAGQLGLFAAIGAVLGAADLGSLTGIAVSVAGNAYSRDQEAQSDALGHALLVRAGIDPGGMATFFDRLAAEGPNVPALLSSHPGSDERARLARARGGVQGEARALPAPGGVRCR